MRRAFEVILVALFAATGCTTPPPSHPLDPPAEARPATPASAILVDDDGSGIHLRARPIDPVTLEDVPGYAPMSFGHHYLAAVSPAGGLIAAILWPSGSANSGATMHLIDTTKWTDRELPMRIDTYTSPLRFDERGAAVLWTQPISAAPAEDTSAVWRLDVAAGTAREAARLPAGLSARDAVPFGDLVAVFAQPGNVTVDGQRRDMPSIIVIDPITGATIRTMPLPIRAGQYQDPSAVDPNEPWRYVTPGIAWDMPRARAFVADADSDRVYRVDLRSGAVAVFEPQPRRSLLDLVWTLLGGSIAEAKLNAASRQEAAISPAGDRLYVSGSRTEYTRTSNGQYQEQITPLDLRIIDTRDMSEIARQAASTGPLWVSPDGASLLYGTAHYDPNATSYAFSDFKLHVADGATARDRGVVDLSGEVWIASVDSSSRTAYVVSTSVVSNTIGRATVTAIDLKSAGIRIARDMGRHYADVLLVASR